MAQQMLAQIAEKNFVTAEDVLRLRRDIFGDHLVDSEEVLQLFQLAEAAPSGDPEWRQFLCEAVTDYFVRQKQPEGYVDAEDAAFLIRFFGAPDTASPLKVDALVHLLRHARQVDQSLIDFGMETVRAHVLCDGRVDAVEVANLRSFLFAMGSDGNIAITRGEADFLFDLNDATRDADNDDSWHTLFAQAVSNYVMAHSGYTPPSRARMAELEAGIADHRLFSGFENTPENRSARRDFFSLFKHRPGKVLFGGISEAMRADKREIDEAASAVAEQLTDEEVTWLLDRIGQDGVFDEAEKALIAHLQSLKGELPEPLAALLA